MPNGREQNSRTLMVDLQNDMRQGISIRLDTAGRYPHGADHGRRVREDISYMGKSAQQRQPDI